MATESVDSDMSIGLSATFAAVGLVGALGMYLFAVSGDKVSAGLAFGAAMLAAGLLVAAIHVYG